MSCYNPHMQRGFSLVELSIVLVILGLLTGGILAGQSLIRAAELRAVVSEYQRYTSATQSFRDKYLALPGDMNNATRFWGAAATCPGAVATPSTTIATCNGDGDGRILAGSASSDENYRYWQHLANAGLIEGQYTGVTNAATAGIWNTVTGQNVPSSRLNNAGWTALYFTDNTNFSISWRPPSPASTTLSIGLADSVNSVNSGAVMRPEEAWGIDTKMDDGIPYYGRIMPWPTALCTNTPATRTANYLLTSSTIGCGLMFINVF